MPAPAPPIALQSARPRLVGREQPLGSLRERLASAGDGEPGLLLVSGETGVGKSRLLSEFAAVAREDGATVLSGGCGAHPPSLPYGPFAVALETYAAGCSEAERDELCHRHPGLIHWLPSLPADGRIPGRNSDHLELSASVARLLTELGRDRPVVLILGDLGECDGQSLDLLAYLAHLAPTRRWLLLGVLTEDHAEPRPDLRRTADSLMREGLCITIELQCLSRDECDELVSALLPGHPVDPAVLERIYGQCRGNPLFVEELIRDARGPTGLIQSGGHWQRAHLAPERVPRSIRTRVARRLELEDATLRRLLTVACAAPETDVPLSWLRAGATALDATVSDGALLDALDRAVEIGVLEESQGGYTFRHPLVRSALSEELSQHRRDHLRAALRSARAAHSSRLRVAGAG
jgi:predicted ATPase